MKAVRLRLQRALRLDGNMKNISVFSCYSAVLLLSTRKIVTMNLSQIHAVSKNDLVNDRILTQTMCVAQNEAAASAVNYKHPQLPPLLHLQADSSIQLHLLLLRRVQRQDLSH